MPTLIIVASIRNALHSTTKHVESMNQSRSPSTSALQQGRESKSRPKAAFVIHPDPSTGSGQALTLGELFPAARLAQTDLLAFHFTRIASHQTGLLQYSFERSIVVDQCTGDAMTHRPGLARFAAAGDVHHDVELAQGFGQCQRLAHDHATGFAGKEHIHRLVVHHDVALACLHKHTCHRTLAATGSVVISYAHSYTFNKLTGFGCCASCGCAAPAYTFILRNIA